MRNGTHTVEETVALKPCPFCGGEAKLVSNTSSTVQCQNDQCIIGDPAPFNDFSHRSDAIAAWNTRLTSHSTPAGEDVERVRIAAAIVNMTPERFMEWAADAETYPNCYKSLVDRAFAQTDRVIAVLSLPPSTHDELVEALEHAPMEPGSCGFNPTCTCKGGCLCQQCQNARREAADGREAVSDFGIEGNCAFAAFKDVLTTRVRDGSQRLDGQTNDSPTFWIEVTKGLSGYFAVMLWNGDGFAEPWDTGIGRFGEPEPAIAEGRRWAEEEGIEFRGGDR